MHCYAPKVKICGITSLEDALAACEFGADALGFNFAEEARRRGRYIDPDDAAAIVEQIPPFVVTVAVCVNDSTERMLEYLTFLDRVQMHGEESVAQCEVLGPSAIKAFRVGPDFDLDVLGTYRSAGAILLDAYAPNARGGTGQVFDWDVAAKAVALGKPLILAGGLTPENVAEAVQAVHPYAVDTAGGVESAPGKKDHAKLRSFVQNAKKALPVSG
ncbi:MAG TPA: phosphoribosylanthranilate isomerase [Candidatus Hydrogenedentes bacterium]|nr:phosphoribosylanthranilate isomerase [Candidatus Hydrogenedentota bacterium]